MPANCPRACRLADTKHVDSDASATDTQRSTSPRRTVWIEEHFRPSRPCVTMPACMHSRLLSSPFHLGRGASPRPSRRLFTGLLRNTAAWRQLTPIHGANAISPKRQNWSSRLARYPETAGPIAR